MMQKEAGFDFTCAWIEMWLVDLRLSVNIGKRMTDDQCTQTAILLLQDFYNLKIADINLIFRKAKTGQFGEMYNRLDGVMIYQWFDQYFNQRCEIAEQMSQKEHDNLKYNQEREYSDEKRGEAQNETDFQKFRADYLAKKMD